MIRIKKRPIMLKVAAAIVLLFGLYFFFSEKESVKKNDKNNTDGAVKKEQKEDLEKLHKTKPPQTEPTDTNNGLEKDKTLVSYSLKRGRKNPPKDAIEFEDWAIDYLMTEFGGSIQSKRRQAELLGLRKYLIKRFPHDWQLRLDDILSIAFPEDVDNILETFAQFDTYNQWFDENASILASFGYNNLKDQLNQVRAEIFGEAANEIWSPRSKTVIMKDVMAILDHAEDIPIEDQLYVFKSAVDELYQSGDEDIASFNTGETFVNLDQGRIYQMTTSFLSMESVQNELQYMDEYERAESLDQIRRQMGFDQASLEVMAQKDRENEQRWQNGLAYMQQRDELTREYSGAQLDNRLNNLRRQYFKDEADTIAAEEATNFFRYNRRRIYGRN